MRVRDDPYRRIAKWYDRLVSPITRDLMLDGLRMFRPKPGNAILDVGCGTGLQLDLWHRYRCRLYGIDSSAAMLDVARRRLGDAAHLRLGDASELPYDDNMFDLVTCTFVLHGMEHQVRLVALKEMKRVMKDGGRILLTDLRQPCVLSTSALVTKLIIFLFELVEGRGTFANYRYCMSTDCRAELISKNSLEIEKLITRKRCNTEIILLRKRALEAFGMTEQARRDERQLKKIMRCDAVELCRRERRS